MASSLSGEVSLIVDAFRGANTKQRDKIAIAAKSFMSLDVTFHKERSIHTNTHPLPEHLKYEERVSNALTYPVAVYSDEVNSHIVTEILLDDGLLVIHASHKRLANPTTYIFVLWMIGTASVLILVSILFLRGQIRSIIRLAKAAELFGKGQDTPDFKPQGAREIRLAAIAFIQMRERIKRLLDRRTQMLASVSHDLRTPLTRMKLQLELMSKSEERDSLEQDILEMQRMLDGYLDFARGVPQEKSVPTALIPYIHEIEEQYKNHDGAIENYITDDITVHIRPESFKRALYNIIDNGLHYGSNVAILTKIHPEEDQIDIYIDDNGPGIPPIHHQDVFQAFFRLDEARGSTTGGVGLGLSITRDIINRHGGDIQLDRSPKGGLRVIITLPL